MNRISLAVKLGFLMTLAILLVSAAGYLTYNNLSSIVASIEVKSRPDLRLLAIRDIASDLDKAESSVRMYTLSGKQQDIKPYYDIIENIDEKIGSLRAGSANDNVLLPQIDTISNLIEENMLVWNDMLDLHHSDSLDIYIRMLTAKIAVGTLNKKTSERSILRRVFSRKAVKAEAQRKQELISDLNKIEKQDSLKKSMMRETEAKLAVTGNEIRERLYMLISRMEDEVINSINENSKAADLLANKTYQWLALFAALGTLLVISVLMVVVRYVRKTREYQKALEKSKEETELLAKTRELFVANMSHEIRTPVNAIHGFAGQLIHGQLDEKSRKMAGIIKSTSDHLARVVNDILDFSKLEHATIELEKTHFRLQPLLEELRLLFAKNVAERKTLLYYTISKNMPEVLYGDSYRLKQILINLTGNSVKFTSNGEICISVEAGIVSNGMFQMTLKVSDTGIGISKDMQTKVFDDFTQADAGTVRKYGGTGLGLSIVKKLVELHNGNISLESELGKGTAITIVMPYLAGNPEELPLSSESPDIPEYFKKLKVLVVDDEAYNRMLFRTIFDRWQISCNEAGDGAKALEMIKTESYDLVFMDARMPGMDGMEASAYIRNKMGIAAGTMPIVGTSATHTVDDIKTYLSAGMNAFLPKPFTESMLFAVIQSLIRPVAYNRLNSSSNEAGIGFETQEIKDPNAEIMASSKSTNPDDSGVDLTSLYHLANNDVTFVRQLLHTFMESTEQGLQEIKEAIEQNDTLLYMNWHIKFLRPADIWVQTACIPALNR